MPKKQIAIILQSILAMMLYFLLLQVLDRGQHSISNLILAFSFCLIAQYLLNSEEDIFTVEKIIIYLFFVFGIFFRVILIKIFNEDFQSFAYVKLANKELYFINTSVIILISILFFIIGKKISKYRKIIKIVIINNTKFKEHLLILFYIILILITLIYKFNNIRLATSGYFGIYDNFVGMLSSLAGFISIVFLVKFFKTKSIKYIILYLLYIIPEIIISFINAWRGPIVFDILLFFVALNAMKVKYNKTITILLILSIFLITFPLITMYRTNLSYNKKIYEINVSNAVNYLSKNNLFRYLSGRFGYYDEIYLACNIDEATKIVYRNTSGLIHENILVGFIPRMIYTSKKIINIGRINAIILTKLPEKVYNNIAISYIGELFINYSYWGVAIFNLLLGFIIGYINKMKDSNKTISISKYAFYGFTIIGFLEGDLAAKIIGLLSMVILINLVCFIFKIDEKEREILSM